MNHRAAEYDLNEAKHDIVRLASAIRDAQAYAVNLTGYLNHHLDDVRGAGMPDRDLAEAYASMVGIRALISAVNTQASQEVNLIGKL